MDLGATICTPRNPACGRCPVRSWCRAYAEGDPESYPVKAPKAARPHRTGTAYWLEDDGEVLLVRRPGKGLLGGMLALPEAPPVDAAWEEAGAIEHVFTHFSLTMTLLCARTERRIEGIWQPAASITDAGLPTLFAKLAARGLAWSNTPSPSHRSAAGPSLSPDREREEAHDRETPLPFGEREGPKAPALGG